MCEEASRESKLPWNHSPVLSVPSLTAVRQLCSARLEIWELLEDTTLFRHHFSLRLASQVSLRLSLAWFFQSACHCQSCLCQNNHCYWGNVRLINQERELEEEAIERNRKTLGMR